MNHVHEIFEQKKHWKNRPDARTYENAIERLLLERCRHHAQRGLAAVDKQPSRVVSEIA